MTSIRDHLAPQPKELELTRGSLSLPGSFSIEPSLQSLASQDLIEQHQAPDDLPQQGYLLEIHSDRIRLSGADSAGLIHGLATLAQLVETKQPITDGDGIVLPGLVIRDWPDFPVRGLLLDISRDRVPTLENLYRLVDQMAGWKLNQLQLYTEHAFAYRDHEVVWRDASPMTCEEIRGLDRYCRDRAIELVPNQNSFGHLHRWLIHEPYRALAECPDGVSHPFSDSTEPFSLCPVDPASLELLAGLYDELLPCFTSSLLNVGFDEAFDLGMGRSQEAVETEGKDAVFLRFLEQVQALAAKNGRRIQIWADMIADKPEVLGRLPADVMALEWGYEADHPFDERCSALAAAGLDFYVCPGTSSWNSLAGRVDNALANLSAAARAGDRHGAVGYLITDWGDSGHWQPRTSSLPGLLAGACFAWNAAAAVKPLSHQLADWLDRHAFRQAGLGLGRIALELGNVYRLSGTEIKNGTVLFQLLLRAAESLEQARFHDLSIEGLNRVLDAVSSELHSLETIQPESENGRQAKRELEWVGRILQFSCRLGQARLAEGRDRGLGALDADTRQDLTRDLRPLIDEFAELWHRTSRPGGFADSVARFERLHALLL